jgi:hypothetical protein
MCEGSTVEVRVQRARAIKTRENVEAKVNARNDKSQYHLRMYCETAQLTVTAAVPRSPEKSLPSAIMYLTSAHQQLLGNPMRTAATVSDFALPLSRDWRAWVFV